MFNLGEQTAWYSGFDKEWSHSMSTGITEHIPCSEFKDEVWGWYFDNYKGGAEVFQMNWPKLSYTLGNLMTELDFFANIADSFTYGLLMAYIGAIDVLDGELMWVGDRIGDAFSPIYNFFAWLFAPIDYSDDTDYIDYGDDDWYGWGEDEDFLWDDYWY